MSVLVQTLNGLLRHDAEARPGRVAREQEHKRIGRPLQSDNYVILSPS